MTDVAIPDLNASPSAELTDLYEISKSNLSYKQSLQQVLTLFNGKIQSAITDDSATNAAMYLTWVTATTGNLPLYVSSTKLSFHPDTGTLSTINLNLNALTASQIVVTDSGKTFTSLPYGTAATANLIVQRDGSGNIAGNTTGNSATTTKLFSSVTIGGTSFDGSANIKIGALNSTNVNSTTSAELAGIISDETGSGALVFANSPTLSGTPLSTTPSIGDNSTSIATTAFVTTAINAVLSGAPNKAACKYSSTTALTVIYNNGTSGVGATLTGVALGALTLDGGSPAIGDRANIKNQASPAQNGIYTVTVVGDVATAFVLTRSSDFNQSSEIAAGDTVFITNGTTLANTTWTMITPAPITLGTTAITWTQIAGVGTYVAGTGLTLSGSTFNITNTVTAGSAGSASVIPIITYNNQGQITSVTTASSIAAATATNVGITNDTTTDANMFLTWVTANTGNLPVKVSNSKLLFNPNSGTIFTVAMNLSGLTGSQVVATDAGKNLVSLPYGTAASANLLVQRDGSGNITGNADTATKLAATKNINGVAFDGSANIIAPIIGQTLTNTGTCVVGVDNIISNVTLASAAFPAAITAGQMFKLTCTSASGVQLIQNAGQQCRMQDILTTSGAGGSLTSLNVGYCDITVLCITTNTTFQVISATGLWSIV